MAKEVKLKTALKRTATRKRLKDQIDPQNLQLLEDEYMDKILDPDFPLMSLRNDKVFWKLMGTNNDFNTSVVITIVATIWRKLERSSRSFS